MSRKKPDTTLSLFGEESIPQIPVSEYVARNKERIHRWASKGIRFGTSSWKYAGWKDLIYTRQYPSKKAFEQECLAEFSELFPTVTADFALYDFPKEEKMRVIHDQMTDHFKLSLKVTDRITIKRYPNIPRYGSNAGTQNPDFLNVELFEDAFLKPIEALKTKRGAIIFEFSSFHPSTGVTVETLIEKVSAFLERLPKGYEYAIELRNSEFLTNEYFVMLASHGVAHVLNNWTRMPSILNQIQLAGVLAAPFSVARALLKTGRTYEQAVEMFQPYDRIREENPEIRLGIIEAVRKCLDEGRSLYVYVNNRAEGNSPKTIEGILDALDQYPADRL